MNPIFVRKINHLTDARYFAAMGVDWMSLGLNTDPASFMLWHTLKDWVAGVRLAAEIDTDDEMILARIIIDAKPEGIVLNKTNMFNFPAELDMFYEINSTAEEASYTEGKKILLYNEMIPIESVLKISADNIFLQASWSNRLLADLLSKGYAGGICFEGGDEEKTGVRDYRAIDAMMEILGG